MSELREQIVRAIENGVAGGDYYGLAERIEAAVNAGLGTFLISPPETAEQIGRDFTQAFLAALRGGGEAK